MFMDMSETAQQEIVAKKLVPWRKSHTAQVGVEGRECFM